MHTIFCLKPIVMDAQFSSRLQKRWLSISVLNRRCYTKLEDFAHRSIAVFTHPKALVPLDTI